MLSVCYAGLSSNNKPVIRRRKRRMVLDEADNRYCFLDNSNPVTGRCFPVLILFCYYYFIIF